MILRGFDENLATKSSKVMINELYDHIRKVCARKDV